MSKANQPDKRLAAVCGLFCPACTVYIATHEDPERLKQLAERMGQSVEETRCEGCRSEVRNKYCKSCAKVACAAGKGVDFCGACDEYPCQELKDFQVQMPHRNELWESLDRINGVGFEQWYAEMAEHYACPECQTINSAYDFKCHKCGATPSSNFLTKNKAVMQEWLAKRK